MWLEGDPIWVRTLSSHCRGPSRWISIQHGVDVTSCRWYSAPHPLTNDILSIEKNIPLLYFEFLIWFAIFHFPSLLCIWFQYARCLILTWLCTFWSIQKLLRIHVGQIDLKELQTPNCWKFLRNMLFFIPSKQNKFLPFIIVYFEISYSKGMTKILRPWYKAQLVVLEKSV